MENSVKIHSFESLWRKSEKRLKGLRSNLVKRQHKIDKLINLLYWEDKQNNYALKDVGFYDHMLKIYRALQCEYMKVNHIIYYKSHVNSNVTDYIKQTFINIEKEYLNKDLENFKPYYL